MEKRVNKPLNKNDRKHTAAEFFKIQGIGRLRNLTDGYMFNAADDKQTFYYEGNQKINVLLPNANSAPDMTQGWEIHILQGDLDGKVEVVAQAGINLRCVGGKDKNQTKGPGAKISIQLLHEGGLYLLNGNNGG